MYVWIWRMLRASLKRTMSGKTAQLIALCIYWLALNLVTLHPPFDIFPKPPISPLTAVQMQASDFESPALLSDKWHEAKLPDSWLEGDYQARQVWYRINFPRQHSSEKVWAIYLPYVSHNAEVYLNGVWVGRAGKFADPVSRNHNRPLLFEFNSQLLELENELLLRVKAASYRQGFLDQIFVGPANFIQPYRDWKKLIRIDLVYWATVGMLLLAVVVFLFWIARTKDTIYLVFSAELVIWSVHNFNLFVTDIPMSARLWEALIMTTLGWTVVLMMIFNHRYLGDKKPRLEAVALLFSLFGCGIFFLPDVESILVIGYRYWDAVLIVIGSYCIGYLVQQYLHTRNKHALLMIIVGVPMLVFGLHDILLVNNLRSRSEGLIIQYSALPAVILFTWFLVRRFVNSLNIAEELSHNLEQKIRQKEIELQNQYRDFQRLESEKVLAEERERIMRDMHDGIGGQLVSVAAQLEGNTDKALCGVREQVLQSIADLRMVIDSLDPMLGDVNTLLGTMRQRLAGPLERANIGLIWEIQELPNNVNLSPQQCLHLMRIIQESVTNTIKHSGSGQLRISSGADDMGCWFIEIEDYGRGFDCNCAAISRGLNNLRYRAEQLRGDLQIRSSPMGTRLRFVFA